MERAGGDCPDRRQTFDANRPAGRFCRAVAQLAEGVAAGGIDRAAVGQDKRMAGTQANRRRLLGQNQAPGRVDVVLAGKTELSVAVVAPEPERAVLQKHGAMAGSGGQLNQTCRIPGFCLRVYYGRLGDRQKQQKKQGQDHITKALEANCDCCAHGNTIL